MDNMHTALPRELRTVVGTDLVTAGTLQLVVVCPGCGAQHRHLGLGLRRSPCGTTYYIVQPDPIARLAAA